MKQHLERVAFYLTCASTVSILFSIAVSQILMALAFAALLFSGAPMRFPPIKLPLALFMLGTVIALLLSSDPRSGTPQIRKFYVFLILLLIYSTFKAARQIQAMVLSWAAVASLSAARSFYQFVQKYEQAKALHQSFYESYVGERITGFTSHWMTFGAEEMIVLLMLASYLFFARDSKWKTAGWICAGILLVSLVLGLTRSIFLLGMPLGMLYLLWHWHRWLVIAAPLAAAAVMFAIGPLRERADSIIKPHGETDSNMHRTITRRTGLEIIRAHPLFGIGPEQVKAQFDKWVPADIPHPLPRGWYGHLHNIYLQYAAERGIPTMLAMMWLIGKVLLDFYRGLKRGVSSDNAYILYGGIAVILAILAEGLLEYNLGDSEVLTMFLSTIAFGYIVVEERGVAVERA